MKTSSKPKKLAPGSSSLATKKLQPIFKWPGGKSGEMEEIRKRIPIFKGRFLEPFLGGGAVWLDQNPQRAIVSDLSGDIISLFLALQDKKLAKGLAREMLDLATRWDALGAPAKKLANFISPLLITGRKADERNQSLEKMSACVLDWLKIPEIRNELWSKKDKVKEVEIKRWQKAITTKLKRIVRQEARSSSLSLEDLYKNIETALRTAFYTEMRHRLNVISNERDPKRIAAWFFVRDLCYASMFRYNDKGEFNIPYGGMGYNKKKLTTKVKACFAPGLLDLVRRSEIKKEDFATAMESANLTKDDFIFLDPPYDSEFNAYEGRSFDQERQKELANFLKKTPAEFLLVIKATPFIASLYDNQPEFLVERIKKNYLVNVQNRNQRAVDHLYVRRAGRQP